MSAPVLDHNGHPVAGVASTYPSDATPPELLWHAVGETALALTRRIGGRPG